MKLFRYFLICTALMSMAGSASAVMGSNREAPRIQHIFGDFTGGDLASWDTHGFNGQTEYRLTEMEGRRVLHALCHDSASGLVKNEKVDLLQTPILKWSWRVENIYESLDETTREGDDYPASLYVAVKTGMTMLSVRVLHYVWSSTQPEGHSWDSAFTGNVKQVAVRSGLNAKTGEWYEEVRNVRQDFAEYFGLQVDELDSLSLMTDCDNSDSTGEAFYGDIQFVAEPDAKPALVGMDLPASEDEQAERLQEQGQP